MLFNSLQFALFFVIVYSLYLILKHRWQNYLLLIASYVFYGWWDWRFLSLIFASTLLDYFCGLKIGQASGKNKKIFLYLSVAGNLSILGFFKYYNFFAGNLKVLFDTAGITVQPIFLDIILPVGISFYTFQTMSYTIDIYRGELKPTKHFLDFALFVAFFPQLVAGPIERAKYLLPQILKPRQVTAHHFYQGCYQIFWGLFLKMFVADNMAKIVDPIFAADLPNGAAALLGMYAFTFQIFCDFAGYSSMARGLGQMMGFEIMLNFNLPFFVTNVQEFWNKWHMSLSTWVRDYVYMPLISGLRSINGTTRVYASLMISMALMGLWHGAAWTYVVFGIYYGFLLVIFLYMKRKILYKIRFQNPVSQKIWFAARVVFMFHLTAIGMMIFRAQGIGQAWEMFTALFTHFQMTDDVFGMYFKFTAIVAPLLVMQCIQFKTGDLMFLGKQPWLIKTAAHALMLYLLLGWGVMTAEQFIYFQF